MPSHLRQFSSMEEPFEVNAVFQPTSPLSPPAKKQRMSLTQTYYVASTARSKLGKEASRSDHNLRRLVGHANLLDNLMVELADAEREQEAWFNQSVRRANKPVTEPRHIQWIDSIVEDEEMDDEDDDSSVASDDSDIYDEDADLYAIPLRRIRSPPVTTESRELEEDEEDLDYEDDEEHALTRVPSQHAPPELLHDDSDSEDDSMPSSPEQEAALELSEKDRQAITTTTFYQPKSSQGLEEYITRQSQTVIAAY